MKRLFLVASIAALSSAGPALGKPGHGNPHNNAPPAGIAGPVGYGAGGCPPGLAKKNPNCMPPGRYKKLFEVGQRVPRGHPSLMAYNQLPYSVRDRYSPVLDPRSRYIYDQGYLYRVDPTTMLVSQIVNTLLRP
jgi:hypothetical protein